MPDILKNDIVELLADLHNECDKPPRMDNKDTLMCDVYIWQEIMVHAKKKYDEAMKDLATLVPDDTKLRSKDAGDHTIETGNSFAFVVKIARPGSKFNKEEFIAAVARKFRIHSDKLTKLAEATKLDTAAAVSKRIIEL